MQREIFTAILLLIFHNSYAQIDLHDYDTIPIRKPTEHKLIYEFNNHFFRAISIKRDKVIAEGNYKLAGESMSGPNSLMGMVGGRPVPNRLYPSMLHTDPPGYDWTVDLYSRGTTRNDLLKTADEKTAVVPANLKGYWQSGSLGLIRHFNDTIAVFGLSLQPEKDSLFRKEYMTTRGLHPPVDPIRKKWDKRLELVYTNFGVFGEFKGAELMIIFYERNRTAYIFLNNNLDAIFQIDYDMPGARIIKITKGYPRVPPVLLLRKGVTEDQDADLSRLAIFCMLMAQLTS